MIQREQGTIKEKIIIYLIGAGVAGFAILLGILGGPAGWGVALGGLAGAIFGAGACAAN